MVEMLKEIQEKLGSNFTESFVGAVADHEGEFPEEDINPPDIPF